MAEISQHIQKLRFKPTILVDQVSKALTDAIVEGVLKGGDQLIEAELVTQFGISRSPLREAFRDLEKKGLVVIIPWRGTFVKNVTSRDIEDNFPTRAVLEGLAARMAHRKMGTNDLKVLQRTLRQMERTASRNNVKEYRAHHIQFHEIFINCSGNDVLINTLKTLRMHNVWYRFSFKYYQEDLANSIAIHQKIFDLFQNKETDEDEIEKVVRMHIMIAFDKFMAYLKEQQGDKPEV